MLIRALAIAIAACLVAPIEAAAHRSASRAGRFYRERYLVCARAPVDHVHCAGPVKGKARLLAALAVAPGRDRGARIEAAHAAAVAAAYFDVREAVPPLRALLAQRPAAADRGRWEHGAVQGLRAEAAYALAHLGDAASAAEIAALVHELEERGHGSLWLDTLAALAVLDPARASRYAIDFLGRARDFRTSMPGGSSKLAALDFVRAEDRAAALPVLARQAAAEERGYDHAHCRFMAARARLDPAVRASVRRQLVGSYSGTWLAGCADEVLPALGDDPDDAEALVRHLGRPDRGMDLGMANIAYTRILALIEAMDARAGEAPPGERARIGRAREALRRGLAERSRWPHVADPRHASYQLHYVALHHAALAGLGDAPARQVVADLIDRPGDRSGAAWLAAEWALRLRLPGAAARAGALVLRGVGYESAERRGFLYGGVRARVLAAFAELHPDDARWTPLLLDAELGSDAAEQALYRIARRAPPGTCEAVTAAARGARPEAVEHAFLALAAVAGAGGAGGAGGGAEAACRPALERVLDDASAPPEVRGTALELLAAMEAPRMCERVARARREGVRRPAIERAEVMLGAPCGPAEAVPASAPAGARATPRP